MSDIILILQEFLWTLGMALAALAILSVSAFIYKRVAW